MTYSHYSSWLQCLRRIRRSVLFFTHRIRIRDYTTARLQEGNTTDEDMVRVTSILPIFVYLFPSITPPAVRTRTISWFMSLSGRTDLCSTTCVSCL